jgi:hypothetical protein
MLTYTRGVRRKRGRRRRRRRGRGFNIGEC